MTYREFYTATIAVMNVVDPVTIGTTGITPDELITFATNAIATLNAKNNNRKTTGKTAEANATLREKVSAFLPTAPNEGMTAKQIARKLTTDIEEISTQKVYAVIKSFPMGIIETYDSKDEKKNKVKFYRFANTDIITAESTEE